MIQQYSSLIDYITVKSDKRNIHVYKISTDISEHRKLYSNMGMRIEYTIFLMMRLKSFRPEVDKSWQSRRECQK